MRNVIHWSGFVSASLGSPAAFLSRGILLEYVSGMLVWINGKPLCHAAADCS